MLDILSFKGEKTNMSATSVTGVGRGMAGNLKGPGNGRNYFVPQVTPHVVAAGQVTLATNVATVTFPAPLEGSETNYVVMLTVSAAAGAGHEVAVSAKTDSGGNFVSFAIQGAGASDNVMWAVMKAGWGLGVSA